MVDTPGQSYHYHLLDGNFMVPESSYTGLMVYESKYADAILRLPFTCKLPAYPSSTRGYS